MKALITGILGQDGAYLAKSLLESGYEVHGATRRWSFENYFRLKELDIIDQVKQINLDITDAMNCYEIISKNSYDRIFNLAAYSFVGTSWDNPSAVTNVNSIGVLNLLEAIRRFSPKSRFYQASTSEMFGDVLENTQSETTPFNPRSPYGVSKVYSHYLVKNYRESYGLFCVSGILFNHESPLRGSEFVTRKITLGFANCFLKNAAPVALGNLDAKRDWGYAPEFVEGMKMMLDYKSPEDFVLATGRSMSVRNFCEIAAKTINLKLKWQGKGSDEVGIDDYTGKKIVVIDPNFYRPAEVNFLLGNPGKAKKLLGWQPLIFQEKLASIMMEEEIKKIK